MINFKISDDKEREKILKVRRLGVLVTTIVPVVYVLIGVGVGAWWWFVSSSEVRTSQQLIDANQKLAQQSEAAALSNKLFERSQSVTSFLAKRGSVAKNAQIAAEGSVLPLEWSSNAAGRMTIKIVTTSEDEAAGYVSYLASKYKNVRLDASVWQESTGWVSVISYATNI